VNVPQITLKKYFQLFCGHLLLIISFFFFIGTLKIEEFYFRAIRVWVFELLSHSNVEIQWIPKFQEISMEKS
jgi:hypothetical protein